MFVPADYTPGSIIYNHPEWQYRKAPGLSSTALKTFVNQSPRHYWQKFIAEQGEKKTSDALMLGKMVHCLVLEPDMFSGRYQCEITPGEYMLRTVSDLKDYCSEHKLMTSGSKADLIGRVQAHDSSVPIFDVLREQQKHDHHDVVRSELYDKAHRMYDSVFMNDTAAALLKNGQSEVSVWANYDGGHLIKCRIDLWDREQQIVVDLKTCACSSPSSFARDCAKFGYGIQQAHYCTTLKNAGYPVDNFVFIAVESEPPFCCQVYMLDDYSVSLSLQQYKHAMEQLIDCEQKDVWPTYADPSSELSLPGWYMKKVENAL